MSQPDFRPLTERGTPGSRPTPCACHVVIEEQRDDVIVYCPLHAQAPAMQKALRELGLLIGHFRSHTSDCHAVCSCGAMRDEAELRLEFNRIRRAILTEIER